jgi:hypothetical protein
MTRLFRAALHVYGRAVGLALDLAFGRQEPFDYESRTTPANVTYHRTGVARR